LKWAPEAALQGGWEGCPVTPLQVSLNGAEVEDLMRQPELGWLGAQGFSRKQFSHSAYKEIMALTDKVTQTIALSIADASAEWLVLYNRQGR